MFCIKLNRYSERSTSITSSRIWHTQQNQIHVKRQIQALQLVPGFGIHDRSKSMLKGKNKPYNVARIRQEKTRAHTPT